MKSFCVTHNRIVLCLVLIVAIAFAQLSVTQSAQAAPLYQQTPCQETWENRVRNLFEVVAKVSLPFLSWNSIVVPTDPGVEQWYLKKIANNGGHRWASYNELEADLRAANVQPSRASPQGQTWKLPQGHEKDPCSAPPSGSQPAGQSAPIPTTELESEAQLVPALQQTFAMFESEVGHSSDQQPAPVGVPVSGESAGDGGLSALALPVLLAFLAFLATTSRRRAHA